MTSPARRPRDAISQTRITGTAKAERKNTAWPGGTASEAALIRLAMAMNTATEANWPEVKVKAEAARTAALKLVAERKQVVK
mgnify:CR=1 FL=1